MFLTCVKNNALAQVHDFMDDENLYLFNSPKVFLSAIYLCLLYGHASMLRLLIKNGPMRLLKPNIDHFTYVIDVAIAKGYYDTVIWFLEYLKSC